MVIPAVRCLKDVRRTQVHGIYSLPRPEVRATLRFYIDLYSLLPFSWHRPIFLSNSRHWHKLTSRIGTASSASFTIPLHPHLHISCLPPANLEDTQTTLTLSLFRLLSNLEPPTVFRTPIPRHDAPSTITDFGCGLCAESLVGQCCPGIQG